MATPSETPDLTPAEREYVRSELDQFFSSYPTVAEGFFLKTWRAGPHVGQPKLRHQAQSLLDRGLMRLDASLKPPRLFVTETGLAALRAMFADGRYADRVKFRHIRIELGLEPAEGGGSRGLSEPEPDGLCDEAIQGSHR